MEMRHKSRRAVDDGRGCKDLILMVAVLALPAVLDLRERAFGVSRHVLLLPSQGVAGSPGEREMAAVTRGRLHAPLERHDGSPWLERLNIKQQAMRGMGIWDG